MASNRNGRWRSGKTFNGGPGLKVTMRRETGVTKGDVLRVPFRFQVPVVGEFSRPYRVNYQTYDTVELGQRPGSGSRELMELTFDTMFMDRAAANASQGVVVWDGVADPQGMLRELRYVMGHRGRAGGQVFRLVITQPAVWGPEPLVNMLAVMPALVPTQRPESVGTEYTSITFLEWPEDMEIGRSQRPANNGATTHDLRPGDTLHEVAKDSHFRRSSAWGIIARANGMKGVSGGSASELAAWAKRHHRKRIKIPAKGAK